MVLDVPDTPGLTWTERSVQAMLANGLRTSEIATIMGVSSRYIRKIIGTIRHDSGTIVPVRGTIVPPGTPVPHTEPKVHPPPGTLPAPKDSSPTPNPKIPDPRTTSGEEGSGEKPHTSNGQIPYEAIIKYLNDNANTAYLPTSKATRDLIKARWKDGFRGRDFAKVIQNMTAKWGDDDKMRQFLRPSTLFRRSHFEEYLNG